MSIDPSAEASAPATAEAAAADVTDTAADKAKSTPTPGAVRVVGIRFRHSKTLWFDPGDFEPQVGDHVIVTTERGTETGECTQSVWELAKKELPAPLKPVVRIADDEDICTDKELQDEERAAMPVFREYIEKNEIDMKPADIEILFGREKMIFYFSAEERIDFRQLVRDLAAHFHCRIEMRQIGVRDEARMTGGIGHCGEVLCCSRLGGEFAPVSIKMAKDQGLPLNPSKISGVCGRLMCCLRYEAEAYKDFNKRAPKKGALIDTPRGGGKVVERDALRETVKLQFRSEDKDKQGDTLMVPLARMCCKDDKGSAKRGGGGCGGCPCAVAPDVFAELEEESKRAKTATLSADNLSYMGLSSTQGTGSAVDNGQELSKKPKRGRGASGKGQPKGKSSKTRGEKTDSSGDDAGGKGRKRSTRRNKGRRRGKGSGQSGEQKQGQQKGQQSDRRKAQGTSTRKGRAKSSGKKQEKSTGSRVETRVPRRRRRPEQ
jgi:cell fate regulator YaaT (PSP1 superfamily)